MKPDNGKDTDLTCSICGAQTARLVRRPQLVGKGANLVIVENMPMYSCRNCGEELYDLATVQLIEKILSQPKRYARMVEMLVARVA
jgi:YgiT-type zinc finger domain-containing protein